MLSEMLVAENHADAIIENKRKEINDKISFLEEKKAKVKEAIAKVGDSEELTEAMNLLDEELAKFEKELQETYDRVVFGGNKGDKSKTHKGEDFEDEEKKEEGEHKEDEEEVKEKYDKVVLGGNKGDKSKTHDGEDYEDEEKKEEGEHKDGEDDEEVKEKYDDVVLGGNKGDKSKTHKGEDYEEEDEKDESVEEGEHKEGEDEETDESVVEKKSEKDYLDDGYVKAEVIKAGNGLRKGQEVMVNAEEYSSMGDDDMLEVIEPKRGKNSIVQKAVLKVLI
jgi:hypothetical protein